MGAVRSINVSSGPARQFTISLDLTAKIISGIVCGGFLLAAFVAQSVLVVGLGLLVLVLAYAYSPRGYIVAGRVAWVKRLIGRARFELEGLREARPAEADDLRGCIRLWGNGGLFGYYGLFRTTKLGRCTWYVTNRSRAVVLVNELPGGAKTALFSPDDVDGFLAAVRAEAPEALETGMGAASSVQFAGASMWRRSVLPASIAMLVLGFVAASLYYSPGVPSYTLNPGALVIHDRFYPVTVQAASVDTVHIRVVDLDSEPDWRPRLRTNGFGNLRYQSGWFKTAGGRKIRLYLAGGRRLVLLPPKGDSAPVLLQVEDPDAFVAQVRQAWETGR
jgi:hypothetical protein